MWTRGSQAFFEGQQKWLGDLAKATLGEQKTAAQPDISGFKAAQEAYSAALNNAMSLSSALMKNFGVAQAERARRRLRSYRKCSIRRHGGPQRRTSKVWRGCRKDRNSPMWDRWNGKFAAVYSAMVTVRQRSLEHQMVMTNAWTRAGKVRARHGSRCGESV